MPNNKLNLTAEIAENHGDFKTMMFFSALLCDLSGFNF